MTFVLLGSGAVRANPRRAGPSQALVVNGEILMFDCGPGATRALARAGFAAENVNFLFLTHLHFDHCGDCPYFVLLGWNNTRKKPLRIFGPPHTQEFVEKGIRATWKVDIATRLAHGKDPFGLDPKVVEIAEAGQLLAGEGFKVAAVPAKHADMDTFAFTVEASGQRIVIIGDTNPSARLIESCRGADLLVCECSGTAEFLAQHPWGKWHMNPATVGALAVEAKVKRLVLKHFVIEDITGDLEVAERMAEEVRSIYKGDVIAGFDGLELVLED